METNVVLILLCVSRVEDSACQVLQGQARLMLQCQAQGAVVTPEVCLSEEAGHAARLSTFLCLC